MRVADLVSYIAMRQKERVPQEKAA